MNTIQLQWIQYNYDEYNTITMITYLLQSVKIVLKSVSKACIPIGSPEFMYCWTAFLLLVNTEDLLLHKNITDQFSDKSIFVNISITLAGWTSEYKRRAGQTKSVKMSQLIG